MAVDILGQDATTATPAGRPALRLASAERLGMVGRARSARIDAYWFDWKGTAAMSETRHRPDIKTSIKRKIVEEAGGKCANPGCPNQRTHIHHIREWSVYQTHDFQYMIAVCPACHDAIHQGSIEISDETIFIWKTIRRPAAVIETHLYVEPGESIKLLLGSIAFTSRNQETIIFELSSRNRLQFRVEGGNILLVDLQVSSTGGGDVLRVIGNYVRHNESEGIAFRQVPGKISVEASVGSEFVPHWLAKQMRVQLPDFGKNDVVTMLSLEVIRPGVVQCQGVWIEPHKAIVVTDIGLHFLSPNREGPKTLIGEGEGTIIQYGGPIGFAVLGDLIKL
jgi:hypothetical protein